MKHRSGVCFFGHHLVRTALDGSHHGEGEHDERDMAMPAMPGSGLVMVEPELVLGGLEAVLDGPAMPFDADQRLDRRFRWAPCGEVGEIAIGDVAPDQQAARPQAMVFFVELFSLEIGQFEVAPVMQARTFAAVPCRQTLPVRWLQGLGNVRGGAGNRMRLIP